MSQTSVQTHHTHDLCFYPGLSPIGLLERVIESNDRMALREIHDHRLLFQFKDGQFMLLASFVSNLRTSSWAIRLVGHNDVLLERAYDLTIDKFLRFPQNNGDASKVKSRGPDCRIYFRRILKTAMKWIEKNPTAHPFETEIAVARIFQKSVNLAFRFSCLEARREVNPARNRYAWSLPGGVIYVWMPTSLSNRKAWLKANVDDPDPARPDERYRVQAIIDANLGVPRHVPLEDDGHQPTMRGCQDTHFQSMLDEQVSVHGLARVVADEKAQDIHKQRWAIRALGKTALRRLILDIFEDLCGDEYEEKRLAETFGISRPTFSRFAGSRWQTTPNARPPDLWVNVAQTLAGHRVFIEAAEQAGVWSLVKRFLQNLQNHLKLHTRRHNDAR